MYIFKHAVNPSFELWQSVTPIKKNKTKTPIFKELTLSSSGILTSNTMYQWVDWLCEEEIGMHLLSLYNANVNCCLGL